MDGRGLIGAGVLALAACRGAHADPATATASASAPVAEPQPPHGITVPADWKELPTVAGAAQDAARAVLGPDAALHAHAWGEASRGCFLAIVDASTAHADQLAELEGAMQKALADLGVTDWKATPSPTLDSDDIQARWKGVTSGAMHARIALDAKKMPHAVAAACFYNDRQPAVCDTACAPLLAMLAPP